MWCGNIGTLQQSAVDVGFILPCVNHSPFHNSSIHGVEKSLLVYNSPSASIDNTLQRTLSVAKHVKESTVGHLICGVFPLIGERHMEGDDISMFHHLFERHV